MVTEINTSKDDRIKRRDGFLKRNNEFGVMLQMMSWRRENERGLCVFVCVYVKELRPI